jgi:hypothetical protein
MSVVGGLFSDVFKSQGMVVPGSEGSIDWSKAAGMPADLNWSAIKPFEVIAPMSWAQTNKDATAPEEAKAKLDSIASTDTRSEYQKWLDGQSSTDGSRGRDSDGKGGVAGNGTNFTDAQWGSIRQMNDEYGLMGNPVNQASMKGLSGLFTKNMNDVLAAQPNSIAAINSWDAMQAAQRDAFANPYAYDSPIGQALAAGYAQGGPSIGAYGTPTAQQDTVNAAVQNNSDFNYSSNGVTDGSDGRSYGISGSEGE